MTASRRLPAGTITLLFTDIEGSTRLLRELGDRYAQVLADHRRVLRDAFARHGGVEVDTQGDAFFYAFASANAAARAAIDAQRALDGGEVRVRIGLHSGEPTVTDEGYVGMDVHRAARIMAVGHGGQVVASQATRELLDAGVELHDLGEHRLKDLTAPQRLWQLGPGEFPPLRTLHHTNLPVQASPLIGRRRELAEAAELVRRHRCVTLTGPGGTGKTRLALQLAADIVEEFPDGVWWVPLAALTDPRLVLPEIGRTIGAAGELSAHLSAKRLLLALDNLEQVIECAPQLAELLSTAPEARLLVTSREPLRIAGEHEYAVEPMEEDQAVALFVQRAAVAEPLEAVHEICRRVDCLPLAVELAAARTAILPPDELLPRLQNRLSLLTAGRRDAPARQRTLRATIEWSHDLLTDAEQVLFRRLAVFAGGWTLEAAVAVADADLDTMQLLVERSLVRSSRRRFGMLETIHEYAAEQLSRESESEERRVRHAAFYLELAERIEPLLRNAEQHERLDELEREHPNLRNALSWALGAGRPDVALRLAAALRYFWVYHSHLAEGRRWLAAALEADAASPGRSDQMDVLRLKALDGASVLATLQGDSASTEVHALERLSLARRLDDTVHEAGALLSLGRPALARGDVVAARGFLEQAFERAREADTPWQAAMATFNLAYVSISVREFERARAEMQSALEQFRPLADQYGIARSYTGLGAIAVHSGDLAAAVDPLRESLQRGLALGDREGPAWALELLADALARTDPEAAARLMGAAETLRAELGLELGGAEIEPHERALAEIQSAIDTDAMEAALAAGRRLSLADAVAFALERTSLDAPA